MAETSTPWGQLKSGRTDVPRAWPAGQRRARIARRSPGSTCRPGIPIVEPGIHIVPAAGPWPGRNGLSRGRYRPIRGTWRRPLPPTAALRAYGSPRAIPCPSRALGGRAGARTTADSAVAWSVAWPRGAGVWPTHAPRGECGRSQRPLGTLGSLARHGGCLWVVGVPPGPSMGEKNHCSGWFLGRIRLMWRRAHVMAH